VNLSFLHKPEEPLKAKKILDARLRKAFVGVQNDKQRKRFRQGQRPLLGGKAQQAGRYGSSFKFHVLSFGFHVLRFPKNSLISKDITLLNRLGLHIRPAALFTKAAAKYRADVFLIKDGMRVNGKSIMGVMMLAAAKGSTLTIECVGDDEQQLCDELVALVENKFNEE
jgi:phosphocarrier protein